MKDKEHSLETRRINGFLLPKFFWPTVRKKWSSDQKKLLKFESEGREFANFLKPLEKFVKTVKGSLHPRDLDT